MNVGHVMDMSRKVIWTVVEVSAPLLIISLVIGVVVSIIQTITSIQEQTLTFVPKFIAIMLVLILFGGWMMNGMVDLLKDLMAQAPQMIKG